MRGLIDSIKGAFARCLLENGDVVTVHRSVLPETLQEGDVVRVQFTIDQEASDKQRELMKQMGA
jgi:hypothetical protein